MELSEASIRGMDNYDDPAAVEAASRGDATATSLGGGLEEMMGLRIPGTGASRQEVQQMTDENMLLHKRLNRRNLLLDAVRKAYIRDVVVVKAELVKSSQKNYQLAPSTAKALPSLDLRPWLKLFAPDECTFSVGGADERLGGHIEIVHRESQKVNQLMAKCEELTEIEQEQRIKATMMEVQAQKDRTALEEQVQKNAEDKQILCAQIEAQKTRLAKFDEGAIDRLTQQVANLQAKLSAASRTNEVHKSDHSKMDKANAQRKALQEEVDSKDRQLKEMTQLQREATTKLEAMTARADQLDGQVKRLEQTGKEMQERYVGRAGASVGERSGPATRASEASVGERRGPPRPARPPPPAPHPTQPIPPHLRPADPPTSQPRPDRTAYATTGLRLTSPALR